MTMRAYDKAYVEDAMRVLGEAFDNGMRIQRLSPVLFSGIFCASPLSTQFERGMPRVVSGLSGDELVRELLGDVGLSYRDEPLPNTPDRSAEYWTGWVLAYAQWASCLSFRQLFSVAPLKDMVALYHPMHEAPEQAFAEAMVERWNRSREGSSDLKSIRKSRGLTQRALSELSGIKLRAIQLYEQGELDISKAAASTVSALARALRCDMADLLQGPVVLEFDSGAGSWPDGFGGLYGSIQDETFERPEQLDYSLDAPRSTL